MKRWDFDDGGFAAFDFDWSLRSVSVWWPLSSAFVSWDSLGLLLDATNGGL